MSKVYTQKTSSSQWALNGNDVQFKTETATSTFNKTLREWQKSQPVITWQKPLDLGYKKQIEFTVITYSEIPSMKRRNLKEKLFFVEHCRAKIREDEQHLYIWLNTDTQNIQGENIPLNQFYLKISILACAIRCL